MTNARKNKCPCGKTIRGGHLARHRKTCISEVDYACAKQVQCTNCLKLLGSKNIKRHLIKCQPKRTITDAPNLPGQEQCHAAVHGAWKFGGTLLDNQRMPMVLGEAWTELQRCSTRDDWAKQYSFAEISAMTAAQLRSINCPVVCTTNVELVTLRQKDCLDDLLQHVSVLKIQGDRTRSAVAAMVTKFKQTLYSNDTLQVMAQSYTNLGTTSVTTAGDIVARMDATNEEKEQRRTSGDIMNTLDWSGTFIPTELPDALTTLNLQLLEHLVGRINWSITNSAGKEEYNAVRLQDVEACMRFCLYGERGALSMYHLDALNGTWVTNLCGLKGWYIYQGEWTDEEMKNFGEYGTEWQPKVGSMKMILIEPGDTLLMLPGRPVVHSVLTIDDSVMIGGMMWPNSGVASVFKTLGYIIENWAVTNERIPRQLPEILNALRSLMEEMFNNPAKSKRTGINLTEADGAALQELEKQMEPKFMCTCTKCEPKSCPCQSTKRDAGMIRTRGCTAWCHPNTFRDPSCKCMQLVDHQDLRALYRDWTVKELTQELKTCGEKSSLNGVSKMNLVELLMSNL
jgi:hypothetical protein